MRRKVKLLALVLLQSLAVSYYVYKSIPDIIITQMFERIDDEPSYSYCKDVQDNTCECDLATFSRLVGNLLLDEYEIVREDFSSASINIILKKGDLVLRLDYADDGKLTSISNLVEKSGLYQSYINEKGMSKEEKLK